MVPATGKSKVMEKTNTGFSAYAKNYGAYTTGKNMTELQKNILESLNLYFEDEGKKIISGNIHLVIDLKQFFKHYRVLNAKFLAERIGMNASLLSQYVSGKKRPSDAQTEKILQGIQEIGRELSGLGMAS